MTEPGNIQAEHLPRRTGKLGRLGLICSLAALGAMTVLFLFRPGWGSPISALGGLTLITAAPLGLLLSLIGLLFDKDKRAAIAGLVIGALLVLLFVVTTFC